MFYILYLQSLCKRRRWPEPHYEVFPYGAGFGCNLRVNHRDYPADEIHSTQDLAREAAAQRAYFHCRNISFTDNSYQQVSPSGGGMQTPSQDISVATAAAMQPRYMPPTGVPGVGVSMAGMGAIGMPRETGQVQRSGGQSQQGGVLAHHHHHQHLRR